MKQCTKCGVEKNLEEFHKRKDTKDGRKSRCRDCMNVSSKKYREDNPEKFIKHYEYEPNAIKKCTVCREEKLASEFPKNKNAKYGVAGRCKACKNEKERAYRKANLNEYKEKRSKRRSDRYKSDPIYRTQSSLRTQTYRLNNHKSKATVELVGCSPEEFWKRNGSPCMEKLKDLDIDHIVPLSWFNLEDSDHIRVACSWTNLQYLGRSDNESKGNRYAGRPDAILGYKNEFDLEKHVADMIEFLDSTESPEEENLDD